MRYVIVKALFVALHLAAAFIVVAQFVKPDLAPLTWTSALMGMGFYVLRMFGITAGYHRYFAHQSYKTGRAFQFFLAWIGCMALQKGPLWWAREHRNHHKYSDTEEDPHSPIVRSVWWAHMGWVIWYRHRETDPNEMKEFTKYPELRWLDRHHWVPGVLLAITCYLIDGVSGLAWSFVVGTVALYHATFLINSVCHLLGSRRFDTDDRSRNNWWAALLTMGEGWHNNHHHYQSSARQGFRWWEIDISYYLIRLLGWLRIVRDIREPTRNALNYKRMFPRLPMKL